MGQLRAMTIGEAHNQPCIAPRVQSLFCAGLRQSLRQVFEVKVEGHSRWIDVSPLAADIVRVFSSPKDLNLASKLLWTTQTEELWKELVLAPEGNTVRAQILAGPSGIGKSHLTYLLALRAYAEGNPVLYIADAGQLYSDPGEGGVLVSSMQMFLDGNCDKFPALSSVPVRTWREFKDWLHAVQAVIVIDEHGHAYRKVRNQQQDADRVFPLLMPNAYLFHKHIRVVFAGSNQASFECDLNDTYRPCLRFIQPFSEVDSELFLSSLLAQPHRHDLPTNRRFANFVARQMVLLSDHACPEDYVKKSKQTMLNKLKQSVDLHDSRLLDTLNDLFRLCSMALGLENLSLLDLGYVYRLGVVSSGPPLASPLCYPATLALLQLWHDVSPVACKRLVDIKTGDEFEQLVWDVLLSRGFVGNLTLQGHSLGYDVNNSSAHMSVLQFTLHEYFVSTIPAPNHDKGRSLLRQEIGRLVRRSQDLGICILYRCPAFCKAFDFAVFQASGLHCVVQASLSDLSTHSKGDRAPNRTKILNEFGLDATLYLYVTTQMDPHTGIVNGVARHDPKFDRWQGCDTFVRLVDAHTWIGL